MRRWRFLVVFVLPTIATTSAIAGLSAVMGWRVDSAPFAVLAPIAMWAPALARLIVTKTVDRNFTRTLSLRRWGRTGAQVMLWPLLTPLAAYGVAYAGAWALGWIQWSPGDGRWTSGFQIAANLAINVVLLGVWGTFTALGEEIGWRGYLQPRLDAEGLRASVLVVWLCQVVYHAPLIAMAGYANAGSLGTSLALFAAGDAALTFIWAHESYRAGSLWPAVFFHSFHNTVSQWLFPRFFVGEDAFWIGEMGVLPVLAYLAGAGMLLRWMRTSQVTWFQLARGR